MSTRSLYVSADTPVHRLTARSKIGLATALSIAAFVFTTPIAVGIVLAVAFGALAWAGGLRNLRRVWFIVVALFVVGFVVWPAFTPARGPTVLATPLGSLSSYELRFALGRSFRIVSFIIIGLAFVSATSNEGIVRGLRSIGLPYAFCFAVGTALRLFPTFLSAADTVRQAQEARGLDFSAGNPIERARGYVPLLVPVFVNAVRQVNDQSMALEARGFDTRGERTFHGKRPLAGRDWIALALATLIVVGTLVGRYGFGVGAL